MKKALILIIVLVVAAWAAQTFTNFKAIDYANNAWQNINGRYLRNIDWSKLTGSFGAKAPDPEKQLNIFIRDGKFVPNLNAAHVGIKATWINEDNKTHSVTGASWGSGEIAAGKAWSKVFDAAGDFAYHCSLHPSETGEIIVK